MLAELLLAIMLLSDSYSAANKIIRLKTSLELSELIDDSSIWNSKAENCKVIP